MSKEDYSLKEFEDWLRNKTIMVCAFKEPINPFEITSTYIEEFKESKEKPRYELIYDGANRSWDIIDNKYDKMKVRSYYIDAMDFNEAYPKRYVDYLNNETEPTKLNNSIHERIQENNKIMTKNMETLWKKAFPRCFEKQDLYKRG